MAMVFEIDVPDRAYLYFEERGSGLRAVGCNQQGDGSEQVTLSRTEVRELRDALTRWLYESEDGGMRECTNALGHIVFGCGLEDCDLNFPHSRAAHAPETPENMKSEIAALRHRVLGLMNAGPKEAP